jgi:hypothetical protein
MLTCAASCAYEMFKTPDTGALKQDKKCQLCWYIILSTMSGNTTLTDVLSRSMPDVF